MSDLYHETTEVGTAEPDTGWRPAQDAASYQQETAEPEPGHGYEAPADVDRYGGYHETEADTEDRIADQDELPTPAESRATTWGDNPSYYDDSELGSKYDGDVNAFIAQQDELPTPQESRARTWGDNPEYYDETDLVSEYDGDLSALTTADDDPYAAQEATPSTGEHSPDDQHAKVEEHNSPDDGGDDQDEPKPTPGDLAGHTELAEPRARKEVAEETGLSNASIGTETGSLAEENRLSDPRTRQETANEAPPGSAPLTEDISKTDAHDAGEAPEDDSDVALDENLASDDPTPEERARLHDAYKDYLKEYESAPTSGWEQGANVIGDKPDRSPGDTTDLPPTGEELLEMDNDKLSRFEKLRRETYEEIDDILDVSENDSGTIQQIFDRPPTGSHTEVPVGHPVVDQPLTSGADGGHFVVAGMVLAIAGVETVRAIRHTVEKWKGGRHGGDR